MSAPVSAPDLLSLIGLSAIVGAGVSAIFNYFSTIRVARKQNQTRLIEEKLALYSHLNFHLDKMRFKADAIMERRGIDKRGSDPKIEERFVSTEKDLSIIINKIDDLIEDKYHLFRQPIFKEWVYIQTHIADSSVIPRLPKLRQMIVDEYNNMIIPEYQKLTGKSIDRIS